MDLAGDFNLIPKQTSFLGFLNKLIGLSKTNITDTNIKVENLKNLIIKIKLKFIIKK
jgi:hypothetical protein